MVGGRVEQGMSSNDPIVPKNPVTGTGGMKDRLCPGAVYFNYALAGFDFVNKFLKDDIPPFRRIVELQLIHRALSQTP